jgi:hypothetical protein
MDSKKCGNRIPRVEGGDPFDQWIVDGHEFGTIETSSSAGRRYTEPDDITLYLGIVNASTILDRTLYY